MIYYTRNGAALDEVVSDLLGSCYYINPAEYTLKEWEELNSQIVECSCCGWWHDAHECENDEEYGGPVCEGCIEEFTD